MSRTTALAVAAAVLVGTAVLCLAWGMAVGERDARALAAHERARHLADCRAQDSVAVVIRSPERDKRLCVSGSHRLARPA